ncbi:MAG: argininosuccinate lyase [Candidatus Bathyarchaeia archaeon]
MGVSLFRERLAKEFDERTARFHTSVVEDLRIFEEDIDGTEAHDIMLHERGVIHLDALKLILKALEEIRMEWRRGEVRVGAEFEDIHEYIERRVIDKIGVQAGGMLHTGRSRNDQVAVDIRMKVREEILETADAVLNLIEALLRRAEEHVETLMMLYTHGQHAQVGTFSHYLLAYADALLRDYQRLMDCYARVNMNPLGAGPVGGTSIGIDRHRTTELLGFDSIAENSIDATSSRDWAIEASAACSILMSNLSRMAADLTEWSTREFGYIELADEYSSSSSIMPQKKNPSTLELIRGKSGEVFATLLELLTMVKGVQSGYYQDLQGTKPPLWRCFDSTRTSLEVMAGIISTLKVNVDRMAEAVKESFTYAVDLAEGLVSEAGISFRESYRLVATLVKEGIDKGISLSELKPGDLAEASVRVLGRRIEVGEGFLREVTDPRGSLLRRRSQGGPNPREGSKMIKERREKLEELRQLLGERRSKLERARRLLRETVASYIEM